MSIIMPIVIGLIAVTIVSLVPEPHRRPLNAILVGGAGAAYLSGFGLGYWEFVLPVVMAYVAYRGLKSWTWIGIGWLLHTVWDVFHHLKGSPILPISHDSSLGCAICDPVIALWCFAGGPSIPGWIRARFTRRPATPLATGPGQPGQPG
jgi:hypothetical protein